MADISDIINFACFGASLPIFCIIIIIIALGLSNSPTNMLQGCSSQLHKLSDIHQLYKMVLCSGT